ncbi:MAG: aldehyde dehydrogenase family protein, partial [Candidatus Harrisonbacteria bacterium]|nr:aldehyde dehydrogenase family protein [Candidatus Harrisonbacteria bacterium]
FTGSRDVGMRLKRILDGWQPARKMIGELGGKNCCIVTPSVGSIVKMAKGVAKSAFGYGGQKCSACARLVVHESLERDTIAAITSAAEEQFLMGEPRDHLVTLGPLINRKALERYARVRGALAEHEGATVTIPKIYTLPRSPSGYYAAPIIVSGLPPEHRFHYDELFLPVLVVQTYRGGISEAVEVANGTEYGLTAGLMSQDENEIAYFEEHMDAGVLYVNREAGATTGAWPGKQSFGGWKNSGIMTQFGVCGPDYLLNFVRNQSRTRHA